MRRAVTLLIACLLAVPVVVRAAQHEAPAPYYVCGDAMTIHWFLHTRQAAPASHCQPPRTLVRIPDDQVRLQIVLIERVHKRYLKLREGVMVEKTPEEQQTVDRAREQLLRDRQREREKLGQRSPQ